MLRRAGGQHLVATQHLVGEGHAPTAQTLQPTDDSDPVAVARPTPVLELGADHHQQEPLGLDLGVVETAVGAELGSGQLEPDQVVRVMDDPHLVGLGVADVDIDSG